MLCIFVEAGVWTVDTGELWRLMLVSGQYLVTCNGPPSQGCPEGQPAKPRSHCFDKELVPALNSR